MRQCRYNAGDSVPSRSFKCAATIVNLDRKSCPAAFRRVTLNQKTLVLTLATPRRYWPAEVRLRERRTSIRCYACLAQQKELGWFKQAKACRFYVLTVRPDHGNLSNGKLSWSARR
jgi:hypothetical protein